MAILLYIVYIVCYHLIIELLNDLIVVVFGLFGFELPISTINALFALISSECHSKSCLLCCSLGVILAWAKIDKLFKN